MLDGCPLLALSGHFDRSRFMRGTLFEAVLLEGDSTMSFGNAERQVRLVG